ncbi:DUF2185 domain-containing protein [Thalassotalea sp. Y01]|uniref:immunity protein Imm33 domain-containing protein n=1 Tax=Thalassotalea sp. Y01 TaxID=2729613 RepID=UPI00145EF639|nr:DUF2185 domain-containing protein [Thalassotalea sp. Y01]NMP16044.1 DUF2185 domain-containing protein [Thalassotalea sp. Y01]
MISKLVSNDNVARLAYREKPFSNQDSGWRVFTSDETGEFLAKPSNILMLDIEQFSPLANNLTRCAQFQLDLPAGSCFEFKHGHGQPYVSEQQQCS